MRSLPVILSLILYGNQVVAQDTVTVRLDQIIVIGSEVVVPRNDTVILVPDTVTYKVRKNPYLKQAGFYDSLQSKSYNKKFTKDIYKLFFRDTQMKVKKSAEVVNSTSPFSAYKGQVISSIEFIHVDVLEGHVKDTTLISQTKAAKVTNQLHLNTQNHVIRSFLLFRRGDKLDPYILSDSERLVRQQPYIEDCLIYIAPNPDGTVRAIVAVKDRIAYGFGGDFRSLDNFGIDITNNNIAGSGTALTFGYVYRGSKTPPHGQKYTLSSRHIFRDFTRWKIFYKDVPGRQNLGGRLERPYVSPEIKYMGGARIEWQQDSSWQYEGGERDRAYHDVLLQNYWMGRNFQFGLNNPNAIILSLRYMNIDFTERPLVTPDSNFLFYDRDSYYASISWSKIRFSKTSYINSFGRTEDVPTGYRFTLTGAIDDNEFDTREYAGVRFGMAKYFAKRDYLGASIGFGGFFKEINELSVFSAKFIGFSRLIQAKRYYYRIFLSGGYILGDGWPPEEQANLGHKSRIRDLTGKERKGRELSWIRLETVIFTPWYFVGFRFAPFIFTEMGNVFEDRAYELDAFRIAFGGGFNIRNESLVFDTFGISYSYLPDPGQGGKNHVIKFSLTPSRIFRSFIDFQPRLIQFK